jgi:arylsulfatase A-like enzyme
MRTPNIVFIVIDSFRPDHLSAFGYSKETDKNLKRIAKEGAVLFKNQFSVANGTAPALTSIFSGLLPSTHGVFHQFPYATPEEYDSAEKIKFWLPSHLKAMGYETFALDWLEDTWFTHGFDFYKPSEEEIDQLFPPTHMTVDLAIARMKRAKKPFLAFLHLWDTHFPFPNTPFTPSGKDESAKILSEIKSAPQREYVKGRMDKAKLFSVEDVVNKYDETIKMIDAEIGRIYDFLKQEKLLDNTIMVMMGDHGDVINEHGIYFANCGLFDEAVRAPLIIKIPGIESREVSEMVQNIDIVPTILEFMGEKVELDGTSLIKTMKSGGKVRDEVLLFDAFAKNVRAVRTNERKLIVAKENYCSMCKSSHHSGSEEYDISTDPKETRNVFSGNSELANHLR